jgi:hypothetical protein
MARARPTMVSIPSGLLIVDSVGRYNMQIFKVGRPAFASGDKARGTPEEYRAATIRPSSARSRRWCWCSSFSANKFWIRLFCR